MRDGGLCYPCALDAAERVICHERISLLRVSRKMAEGGEVEEITGELHGAQRLTLCSERRLNDGRVSRNSGDAHFAIEDEFLHGGEQFVVVECIQGRGVHEEEVDIIRTEFSETLLDALMQDGDAELIRRHLCRGSATDC